MSKFVCTIPNTYDFDTILNYLHNHIFDKENFVSCEHKCDHSTGGLHVAVRIYEKNYPFGKETVGLHLTLACAGDETLVVGVCNSSSKGIGPLVAHHEREFLESFITAAEMFEGMVPSGSSKQ